MDPTLIQQYQSTFYFYFHCLITSIYVHEVLGVYFGVYYRRRDEMVLFAHHAISMICLFLAYICGLVPIAILCLMNHLELEWLLMFLKFLIRTGWDDTKFFIIPASLVIFPNFFVRSWFDLQMLKIIVFDMSWMLSIENNIDYNTNTNWNDINSFMTEKDVEIIKTFGIDLDYLNRMNISVTSFLIVVWFIKILFIGLFFTALYYWKMLTFAFVRVLMNPNQSNDPNQSIWDLKKINQIKLKKKK